MSVGWSGLFLGTGLIDDLSDIVYDYVFALPFKNSCFRDYPPSWSCVVKPPPLNWDGSWMDYVTVGIHSNLKGTMPPWIHLSRADHYVAHSERDGWFANVKTEEFRGGVTVQVTRLKWSGTRYSVSLRTNKRSIVFEKLANDFHQLFCDTSWVPPTPDPFENYYTLTDTYRKRPRKTEIRL